MNRDVQSLWGEARPKSLPKSRPLVNNHEGERSTPSHFKAILNSQLNQQHRPSYRRNIGRAGYCARQNVANGDPRAELRTKRLLFRHPRFYGQSCAGPLSCSRPSPNAPRNITKVEFSKNLELGGLSGHRQTVRASWRPPRLPVSSAAGAQETIRICVDWYNLLQICGMLGLENWKKRGSIKSWQI